MINVTDPQKLQDLQTQEQIRLLDVIDALRAEGLSEYTALPQLIVCGDQSSGKSSVLEAISGVPFPRKDTLCTRFATEVILRRAKEEAIVVSLAPGKTRSQRYRERLSNFRHDLSSREEFPALFEKAKHVMGLDIDGGNAFSEDILRVEVSGPNQPQLTVVDLPGLIHSENRNQSATDVKIVHELVTGYMLNPRSIILAVVTAMNDIANQIVIKLAREVDPEGKRTLGVITKPDTLKAGSPKEKEFLALARNEDVKFHLGWHAVKNLDLGAGDEGKERDRDNEETLFFQTSNFKSLPTSSTGISSLRHRLSQVLFNQVRSELPDLIEDIQSGIATSRAALEALGPSRVTEEEQRAFLIKVSQSFQILCKDGINGQYSHPFFENRSQVSRRLCAVIANSHDDFAADLHENGARWVVSDTKSTKLAKHKKRRRTREDAINQLPGLVNPLLVGEVFREYSRPWEGIARAHVLSVWHSTKVFLEQVLQHLTDAEVGESLLRDLLDPIMDEKLGTAYTKLKELTTVHMDHPSTLNHYFQENMAAIRQDRSSASIQRKLQDLFEQYGVLHKEESPQIASFLQPEHTIEMNRKAAEDLFDNANAYYKVAMKVFLDNVPSLVIQQPIVNQMPSIFCPESVFAMDTDLVKKITSESDAKRIQREELKRKLATLDTGHQICKQYIARGSSVMKNVKEQIVRHGEALAKDQEDERSASEEAAETTQNETEEPSNDYDLETSVGDELAPGELELA